jgi:hypothetical protein
LASSPKVIYFICEAFSFRWAFDKIRKLKVSRGPTPLRQSSFLFPFPFQPVSNRNNKKEKEKD